MDIALAFSYYVRKCLRKHNASGVQYFRQFLKCALTRITKLNMLRVYNFKNTPCG